MDQDAQIVHRAKQQAYRLLAYRSRTSSELRDRLQRRGYTAPIIDEVLCQLASDGYIDDHKIALDWARYRLQAKPLGRRRLSWELQKRGIPSELVEEVLREVYREFDEITLAEQVARKRLGSKELPRSPRERQRYARYLFSLGFEADTVAAALAALCSLDEAREIMSTGDFC
ncbi:MAG: regulatory protein RecX [Candidatus Entotheonellia bacterium]